MIDFCHRLKKPRNGGPSPTIVKFVRRFDKFALLDQRKQVRDFTGTKAGFTNSEVKRIVLSLSSAKKKTVLFDRPKM